MAREFGVGSGMPLRLAARKCPTAVFLPVDAEAYEEASTRVMGALREFDVVVEVMGWDEAFLGAVTGDLHALARQIQQRVRQVTELDCSVGIGQNKLQAKLATGFGKPSGIFQLTGDTWFEVLGDRPPTELWGIGGKTGKKLAALGISTVRELAATDPAALAGPFGPATGPWLIQLGNGRSSSTVTDAPHIARSRSRETTFQVDLTDWDEVRAEIVKLTARLVADLGDRDVARIVVKVRYKPFYTHTHGSKVTDGDIERVH